MSGCQACHNTGQIIFEDHTYPCPYCCPDAALEAARMAYEMSKKDKEVPTT